MRHRLALCAQLALLASAYAAGTECSAEFQGESLNFTGCHDSARGMRILWRVNANQLDTLFIARTRGWAGVAWGAREMVPAHAAVAYATGGGGVLADFKLAGRSASAVTRSDEQKLTGGKATLENGVIKARFTRPLDSAGVRLRTDGDTPLVWAIGPESPDAPALRKHTRHGEASVRLAARGAVRAADARVAGTATRRALLLVHAVLMALAWLVLVPGAVLVMRFLKKLNPTAFKTHRALVLGALVLVIAAFTIGVSVGSRDNKRHLVTGMVVLGFALLQTCLGLWRPAKGTAARVAWFMGHAWIGRITVVLAWVNCVFGLPLIGANTMVWVICVGVLIAVHIASFIALSFMPNRFPTTEQPWDAMEDSPMENGFGA